MHEVSALFPFVTATFRRTLSFTGAALATLLAARGQLPPAVGAVAAGDTPVSPAAVERISLWAGQGFLQTGVGYRDNMQLSAADEGRSSFVRSGLGASVLHSNFPSTKIDYWAALRASGTHYFNSKLIDRFNGNKPIKDESEVFLLGRWNYQITSGLSLSLNGSAYALDQIYDVSDTKYENVPTRIQTTGVSVGPALRWDLTKVWWIKVEADGKRENSPDGFNNRTGRAATLSLGWKPAERFEMSVAGSETRRDYDSREEYLDDTGALAPGTRLKVAVREAELRFDVTLDEAAHWRTGLRLSALHFTDNGVRYLSHRQRKVAPEVEWTSGNWRVYLETSARRLDYEVQTVGAGFHLPVRVSDDYFAHLQIERNLSRRWTVYLDYTWERDRSNDDVASYSLNEGLLGLRWNWEK